MTNKSERVNKLYTRRITHLERRINIINMVLPSLKGKLLKTNERQLKRLNNKLLESQLAIA